MGMKYQSNIKGSKKYDNREMTLIQHKNEPGVTGYFCGSGRMNCMYYSAALDDHDHDSFYIKGDLS